MVRILFLLLFSTAAIFAQESPAPSPEAAASPAPAESPAPQAGLPAAESSPSPAAEAAPSPALEASPTPADASASPAPQPSPDVIPMEGAPAGGAPLDTQNLAPELPTNSGAVPDAAFTDPNAIVPDAPPLPPALPRTVESEQEKIRALNIRYHEVRVQAEKDPQIVQMYDRSNAAKSDEDKRAALREYYRMLFKKIASMDKSLELKCKSLEDAYIRRLAQVRLEPTIPLNPPPTPEPLGN